MWKAPNKAVEVQFDGNTLKIEPASDAEYVDLLSAVENTAGINSRARHYARLIVETAYLNGDRFFDDDDADRLVIAANSNDKVGREFVKLISALIKANTPSVEQARKN